MIKHNGISKVLNGQGFWWLAILIFLSLLYSTSWHYVHGPCRSTGTEYWTKNDEITNRLKTIFPDIGAYQNEDILVGGDDGWKISNSWGDATVYMYQADTGEHLAPPHNSPYRYRMLPVWLASGIHWITGLSFPYSFALLNSLATLLTALFFTAYLIRFHKLSRLLSLIGGILYITSSSVTRSAALPTVDSLSHLWMLLIFWSVQAKNWRFFIIASIAGVFTKEVLAIGAVLYPSVNMKNAVKTKEKYATIALSLIPIIAYVAVRLIAGGRIDEVHYGFAVLNGEFPVIIRRMSYLYGIMTTLMHFFFTFGFLWLGLLNLGKNRFLRIAFFTVCVPISLAVLFFSTGIIRPMGIVFPVVIPLFLTFFEKIRLVKSE